MRWSRQEEVGSRALWYLGGICRGKVLLIALVGGNAGNMATLQSQACLFATTATTIALILKGDPVPEAFILSDVFVLMERFLRFPVCIENRPSQRTNLHFKNPYVEEKDQNQHCANPSLNIFQLP